MNSGNWFVVGILVAMSFQFLSQGAVAPVFSGLNLTVASCGSVIVQTFVALFSAVFTMIFVFSGVLTPARVVSLVLVFQ